MVPGDVRPTVDDPRDGHVYTMTEAARLKGVSYHTVSRAVRRGTLPARRLGRMAFVADADLAAWRPMVERAPRRYRRRAPDPDATPALLDLAGGERVDLAARLSVLLEAIHGAAAERPLAEFLDLLGERLAAALGLRRVAIWGVDRERGVARRLASFGPPLSGLADEVPLAAVPAFERFLAVGEATAAPAAAFGEPPAPLRHVTTLLVVPLRVGGRALGTMQGDRGGAPFALTTPQLALAQAVANHAALAIELAQLRAENAVLRGAGKAGRRRPR